MAETKEVVSTSVVPRNGGEVYELLDGERIWVTRRKKVSRPKDVHGVLQILDDGEKKWLSHNLIDEFQEQKRLGGLNSIKRTIVQSWEGNFNFSIEDISSTVVKRGLRPPQIGGLHAIGAHWSLYKEPATIVMPTGIGKTETMIAAIAAYQLETVLVIVPSKVLRDQTFEKFLTFGSLRSWGNLASSARNPIVGVIKGRPKSKSDLDVFKNCNVIVSTMTALSDKKTLSLIPEMAASVDVLIIDEAHHIGASSWSAFKEAYEARKVLQFTATPFRRDGKLVGGKVIYNYPLHAAQQDGYFKRISFQSVHEIDPDNADKKIAEAAIGYLRRDLDSGKDHLLMARCATKERAQIVHEIYQRLAAEFKPILVHSDTRNNTDALQALKLGESRVVVCVDMLGEGFDLSQLKIAALHDSHKSLGILLQFTGRFTRTSSRNIGDATVVANTADNNYSLALERLYKEDADWNELLSEYSSNASKEHAELIEFLNASSRLDPIRDGKVEVSSHLLHPILNTLVYETSEFYPRRFAKALPRGTEVQQVWLHEESNTLYFTTRTELRTRWTRSDEIRDRRWDLFVLHHDQARGLLFLSSTDKKSLYEDLAKGVGGPATRIFSGERVFRVLGGINRLLFQQIGVNKHGRRNLRYVMYNGTDVATGLSMTETSGSVRSNVSGFGWENGRQVTIGCSRKGRVWTREPGTIPELVRWCAAVGTKLQDDSISTDSIIANVLIPQEVNNLPDKSILSIEFPRELLQQPEERVTLVKDGVDVSMLLFDIRISATDIASSTVDFEIFSGEDEVWASLRLRLGVSRGFEVVRISTAPITLRIGNTERQIEDYLSDYPPLLRFDDLSELDGDSLVEPKDPRELIFPPEQLETWDWSGVDLRKESMWKGGIERHDSIQWRAAQEFIQGGFDVVFNDDGAGEAADLICIKRESDHIRLVLIHCKYAHGSTGGERVKDVMEVCSQAIRSTKWTWRFRELCVHLVSRERRLNKSTETTRFLVGNAGSISRLVSDSRMVDVRPEIIIVQPGLIQNRITREQTSVLAAAHSYLKETIGVDLDVICSA